jgi:hypothetical protein
MNNLTGRRAQILEWSCSRWAGLALVGCVFVLAAALSWRRWPDILVDFGMQLYLPWRISNGAVLYRDVAYLPGGPLSQHFNALLFKIFGVSLRTLIFANLAITAGLLVLVFRCFLAVADQLTATMICLAIVLVFAFQHYEYIGNCNYVTPYCHEVFHGLVLSLVTVAWLSNWIKQQKIRFAALAGLGAGLVFLTKPDIFLALTISVAAAFALVCFVHRQGAFAAKSLVAFLSGGLVPLLGFFAFFLRVEDWQAGLRSVAFAWVPLGHRSITKNVYYQQWLGLDTPFLHLGKMAVQFLCVVIMITIFALAFRGGEGSKPRKLKQPWLVLLLLLSLLLILAWGANWVDCGRSLPLLGLSACILIGLNYHRMAAGSAIFPLLWSVFGVALLAKLGFFSRIWHYGFVLAMPAFTGAVYLLIWLIPVLLARRYKIRFRAFRMAIGLLLLAVFVRLFLCSAHYYLQKTIPVGSGGDEIMTFAPSLDPFHGNVQLALSWIQKQTPSDATVAVFPEGAVINYLGRRVNSNPYLVWLPPEMEMFHQDNMVFAFEKCSTDYVIIFARSTAEYGVGPFGYTPGYGSELMQWVRDHYDEVYPESYPAGRFPPGNTSFATLQVLKRHLPAMAGRFQNAPAPIAGKD